MPQDRKIVVVMPAYNAAKTLRITYADLPPGLVDHVILVDDGSSDDTVKIAHELGLELFVHNRNYGYGANQKTCYREALKAGADIIVMVHPDYQYDPKLLPACWSRSIAMKPTSCWVRVCSKAIRCAKACRGGSTCRIAFSPCWRTARSACA